MRTLWIATLLATVCLKCEPVLGQSIDVWIGTGRSALSKGIYHCQLNMQDGKLSEPKLVAEMEGPGFLEKHPTLKVLYAVGGLGGEQVVAALAMEGEAQQRSLRFLNAVPIGDGGATHVSLDKTGSTLLTAQYGGGSVAAFSVNSDGTLGKRTALIDHSGPSKVDAGRQEAPHAHWTGVSPDNRFAFVPDLGLDKVVIYQLNAEKSEIVQHGFGVLPPGSGPRHMKFHPLGKWIYVVNELALTVTVFDYDAEKGTMQTKQTIETVPAAELINEKAKSTSEIRVHPGGQFVYAANRGHDTLTVFQVNPDDGRLTFRQRVNVRGATPRNFNLSPDGKWLIAAGQLSNTLAVFEVNPADGTLVFNQTSAFAPTPICVLFD